MYQAEGENPNDKTEGSHQNKRENTPYSSNITETSYQIGRQETTGKEKTQKRERTPHPKCNTENEVERKKDQNN